ncbi:DNA polymerase iota isoform X1 [Anopheles bellator]|uniref:DNA polymerase iota isoform X1 n=1 Tax=Anopheles bellator TaxID=139047 RepID=UPI002647CBA9|nr:DNA polymerase iota isoform X1 [Anopheles bellator]
MEGSPETDDEERVHPRVIIHIDMDYYYAQVEEVLNPSLKDRPFAVKQRFCVVTSNYLARQHGVRKLQPVKEALAACPELVLVNGEDLTKYKEMSVKINEIMHRFTPHVEKLGLDENYLDVTELVAERLELLDNAVASGEKPNDANRSIRVVGMVHPSPAQPPPNPTTISGDREDCLGCQCGCERRLALATHLAKEIRDCIYRELGLRCCAGIAHNKLLAKLVGAVHKPNQQTVLLPSTSGGAFLASLGCVRTLTGIGEKTAQTLGECCGVTTVTELQRVELERLAKHVGHEQAVRLKHLALGRDDTPVRQTGKPKSVGLEDSCPSISVRADAEEKFRHLLVRLVKNIADDGRIPIAIKVTIRKFDSAKRTTHRESKQEKLLPSMFRHAGGKLVLADGAQERMLTIVMRVFERMVDLRQPFNITLLGLSFFKFQERRVGSKSIANFLIKKSDIEVQSITNLSNESITLSDVSFSSNKSLTAMDCESFFGGGGSSDAGSLASLSGSESDVEPSPKKSRRLLFQTRRSKDRREDETTLSKLRVADLRLNSKEYDHELPSAVSTSTALVTAGSSTVTSPSTLSPTSTPSPRNVSAIRSSLDSPMEVSPSGNHLSTQQQPPLQDSFFRDRHYPLLPGATVEFIEQIPLNHVQHSKSTNMLPPNVDREVFHALPTDVQHELLSNWRRAMGPAVTGSGSSGSSGSSSIMGAGHANTSPGGSSSGSSNVAGASASGNPVGPNATGTATGASKAGTKNTLHRYFVKNT